MLTQFLRLISITGGIKKDVSLDNATKKGIKVNFDSLLIAQHFPFVNLFFLMQTVNTLTSKFKIEYWDGTEWRAGVDILDATDGLKETGNLQFTLRNSYGWCQVASTDDDDANIPEETQGLFIDNCYWLKLTPLVVGGFVAFDPLTTIKKIGYAFTLSDYVNSVDSDGPSYYESFQDQSNKTDWVPEIMHASEEMVIDLKRVGFIKSAGQIIQLDELYLACAWKTLSHIYFQLGKAYEVNRAIVNNKYEKALSSKALTFDEDMDGKITGNEQNATMTRMTR